MHAGKARKTRNNDQPKNRRGTEEPKKRYCVLKNLSTFNEIFSLLPRMTTKSSTAYDVMFSCDVTPAAFRYSVLLDWALDECKANTKRFYNFAVYRSMQF